MSTFSVYFCGREVRLCQSGLSQVDLRPYFIGMDAKASEIARRYYLVEKNGSSCHLWRLEAFGRGKRHLRAVRSENGK